MPRFSDEDKVLLYITRSTAEKLGAGSWDDCTAIFNCLASHHRTQDGLIGAYRNLKKSKLEARARTVEWNATKRQVAEWLREKDGAPWSNTIPRSGELETDVSREKVCLAPRRTLAQPLTEWSGVNAQMDLGVNAAPLLQQGALPDEQRWAANGYVSNAVLWPVPAAEYLLAGSTATRLNADNEPTYEEDRSAMYNAGSWAGCGSDSSCLYGTAGSAIHGDGSYAYGDGSYAYGDGSYAYGDGSCAYGDDMCMYGAGATCVNAAGSLDVFATDSTGGTTIGSRSSPPRNTVVESYSTTNTPTITTPTTPMISPDNRSCYVPNSPAAGTFSCTASSSVDHGPMSTESPSESLSFGQVVPANTHPQGFTAEPTSILNAHTRQETGGLMSSEELYLLLKRSEADFKAI